MSFLDNLLLWLHIGVAIFTIGPVAAAMMVTPRYIKTKDVAVLRYLNRTTRIFGLVGILVFVFGIVLGREQLAEMWLSISMTLFVVSIVLLFALVERDQRQAIRKLSNTDTEDDARVQTGRIASVSGVITIIWFVVLVLMVWTPGAGGS